MLKIIQHEKKMLEWRVGFVGTWKSRAGALTCA